MFILHRRSLASPQLPCCSFGQFIQAQKDAQTLLIAIYQAYNPYIMDTIRFRIFNGDLNLNIKKGYCEKLNKKAIAYFQNNGIDVELMPPPCKGGAGAEMSLLIKIILVIKRLFRQVDKIVAKRLEKDVDGVAPKYNIYMEMNNNIDIIYDYDFQPGTYIARLVFNCYCLQKFLVMSYPEYNFNFSCSIHYPKFGYSLTATSLIYNAKKHEIGAFIRVIKKILLKANQSECILQASWLRYKQEISYFKDNYLYKTKTRRLFIRNGSLIRRGIHKKSCPKTGGIAYEPLNR